LHRRIGQVADNGGDQVGRVGSKSSRPIQPAKSAQAAAPSSVGVGHRRGLTRLPPHRRGEIRYHCRVVRTRRKPRCAKRLGRRAGELITDDNGFLLSAMSNKLKLNSTCAYSSGNVAAAAPCRVLSTQPSRCKRLRTKKRPTIRYQIRYHRSRSFLIESGRVFGSRSGSTSSQSGGRSW